MGLRNDPKVLIQKYDLKPNKLLGQNFLIDQNVLKKIIAAAQLTKDDLVLEVGPGLGILTEALAREAGRVVAIEKDKKMAGIVRNVLNDRNARNVEIIEGDILKFPISNFQFPNKSQIQNSKKQKYKLVANIPYYLTGRVIRKFLESGNPPSEMILMIQKEVAQRICATPPRLRQACLPTRQGFGGQAKMSLLAVSVQFYSKPKIVSFVSKNSFWPAPKVDSAILEISQNRNGVRYLFSRYLTPFLFFKVVRAGFLHPRKQLINNLTQGLKLDREQIAQALKKIGLTAEQRAETLNVEDWKKLTELLSGVLR